MKPYRDVFGSSFTKQDVTSAARFVSSTGKTATTALQRQYKWGYGKATRIMDLLIDAGVVTNRGGDLPNVILKNPDEAVNAALRQLKKGKM